MAQPGKFLFVPIPGVVDIFIYLHNIVERIVKDGLDTDASKDILKKCLAVLSEDNELRTGFQMAFCLCLGFSIKKINSPIFKFSRTPPKTFFARGL